MNFIAFVASEEFKGQPWISHPLILWYWCWLGELCSWVIPKDQDFVLVTFGQGSVQLPASWLLIASGRCVHEDLWLMLLFLRPLRIHSLHPWSAVWFWNQINIACMFGVLPPPPTDTIWVGMYARAGYRRNSLRLPVLRNGRWRACDMNGSD